MHWVLCSNSALLARESLELNLACPERIFESMDQFDSKSNCRDISNDEGVPLSQRMSENTGPIPVKLLILCVFV